MHKQLFSTLTHCLIFTPIFILLLTFSQPSLSHHEDANVTQYIYNYQVHYACDNWLSPKKDQKENLTDLSEFICGIYFGMVQEQNSYHQSFMNHFKENNDEEMVSFANVYTITGCNIEDLDHKRFAELYLGYMSNNEDLMDYNFYAVVERVLDPYCDSIRDKEIKFHLNEEHGRRQT